ncbi:MAG: molybdenum cofactor guanylyltransferase [Firmicutes bacterium]|nr:molybdenum cofactor guanylyltransferase [Bacillota bacterium]
MKSKRLGGAIVLAGGESSRLGFPKPLLKLNGVPLIEIIVSQLSLLFEEITAVTDREDLFAGLPVKLTGDLLTGCEKSPLRGIHAGLSVSGRPYQFVVACDMPFINLDLVRYMAAFAADYDAVVPRTGSYYQPLHAFYNRSSLASIESFIEGGRCKVIDYYDTIRMRPVGYSEVTRFDPEQRSFFNINTWDDYHAAQQMLSEQEQDPLKLAGHRGKER